VLPERQNVAAHRRKAALHLAARAGQAKLAIQPLPRRRRPPPVRQLARHHAACQRAHHHTERGLRQRFPLRRQPARGGAQQAERENTAFMRIHAAGGAEHRLLTREPRRAQPPQDLAFAKPRVLRALLIKF